MTNNNKKKKKTATGPQLRVKRNSSNSNLFPHLSNYILFSDWIGFELARNMCPSLMY